MALPRYTPGKVATSKPKPPQGQSHKTLTIKVKAHTRKVSAKPAQAKAPQSYLDAPITPGSSITYRQAQRQAANAVKVRYGDQQQGIGQQITAQTQTGAAQQDWYRQYLAQLAQYQTDTQNRAAQTNTAVQQQADSIRSLDQGQQTAQQQAMNTDAAARGATVDPNVANRNSQASVVRQALEGGLGALIAQHGLTASNQAGNLAHVVAPIQQGQAQAANAAKVGSLKEQLTGLKGQEGAYAQSFIDNLSASEAKNLLAAAIAGQGYSLKAATLKETTRRDTLNSNNAKARTTAGQNAAANKVNQYGYTAAEWAKKTPAERQQIMAHVKAQGRAPKTPKTVRPTTGPGSVSPTKEASTVSLIHSVVSMIQRAPKVDSKGIKLTDHELRTRLASPNNPFKKIIDPRIVNIAFDIARNQGLTPPNVRAAHDLGIHVNGHFKILAPQPQSTVQPGIFTGGNPFLTP